MLQKQPKHLLYESKGVVDHSTVTRWLNSDCKNLDDQEKSDRLKSVDSVAILQTIEANRVSSIQLPSRLGL